MTEHFIMQTVGVYLATHWTSDFLGSHKSALIALAQCAPWWRRNARNAIHVAQSSYTPTTPQSTATQCTNCVVFYGAIHEFVHCVTVVHIASTQSSNPMRRASHKYGTIGALLCDPRHFLFAFLLCPFHIIPFLVPSPLQFMYQQPNAQRTGCGGRAV